MKSLIALLLVVMLAGCAAETICFDTPSPPYDNPDKEYRWNSVGLEYRTYTYYCYKGNYIEVTWKKYRSFCWEESEYIARPCSN